MYFPAILILVYTLDDRERENTGLKSGPAYVAPLYFQPLDRSFASAERLNEKHVFFFNSGKSLRWEGEIGPSYLMLLGSLFWLNL